MLEDVNMTDSGWYRGLNSGLFQLRDTDGSYQLGQASSLSVEYRNYFTFDLDAGLGEIIGAELHIAAQVASTGLADAATETLQVRYYDGSTGPTIADLQSASPLGVQNVYNKMESSALVGDLALGGELAATDTVVVTLDQNGILGLLNNARLSSGTVALTGTLDGFGTLFASGTTPSASDVFLHLTTVPEPSSFGLLALGGMGLGVFYRRRRKLARSAA